MTLKTAALIVAAGRGSRIDASGRHPKQYERLGDAAIITHALIPFVTNPNIQFVQAVIHADDHALYAAAVHGYSLLPPAIGGPTRQASVLAGLEALAPYEPDRVLIHDAARPYITKATIDAVSAALARDVGAIAAVPVSDTLKRAALDATISQTVEREGLWSAQTPQGFDFATILKAHRDAAQASVGGLTDDASVAQWAGHRVALVMGATTNVKITTAEDLARARQGADSRPTMKTRTGFGFDVHAFAPGNEVWLGGVAIPHTHKLDGHSDADVVLHALTDALLGTIGDGDIGQHFPPSDPQWRGVGSILFLQDAVRRVRARGAHITHCDITILAEAPRVGPHRPAMQAVIAEALGVAAHDVGVKATTMETLGFIGRREGIAAMAVATIELP